MAREKPNCKIISKRGRTAEVVHLEDFTVGKTGKIVQTPEKIAFVNIIKEIKDTLIGHGIPEEQVRNLNVSDEGNNSISLFIDPIVRYFRTYYFSTIGKFLDNIDENHAKNFFENIANDAVKTFTRGLSNLGINYTQFLTGFRQLENGEKSYYLKEKQDKAEGEFLGNFNSYLDFIKNILGNSDFDKIDTNNFFSLKNIDVLLKIYTSGKYSNIIDYDFLLKIIRIFIWNYFLNIVLNGLNQEEVGNILENKNTQEFISYFNKSNTSQVFSIFVIYLHRLMSINKKFTNQDEMYLYYLQHKLGITVSRTSLDKFRKSGIDNSIVGLSNNKKEFLYKVIFSDINIFCKGGDFINKDLFDLIVGLEEKRYEGFLNIINKGFNLEQIKFIIENNIENLCHDLLSTNINYVIELSKLGIHPRRILVLGNEAIEFLKTLGVQDDKIFQYYSLLIRRNPGNYKNIILNKRVKAHLKADLEMLDKNTPGYSELKAIYNRYGLEKEDHEKIKAEIGEIYQKYGIVKILAGITEETEWNKDPESFISKELLDLIKLLCLNERNLKIVYRILEKLEENKKEHFVLWLLDNPSILLENLKKILSIIGFLIDIGIKDFSLDNILKNHIFIDIEYLRGKSGKIKEVGINGEIINHILYYFETLEKTQLNDNLNEEFRKGEIVQNTKEDEYISITLRDRNPKDIRNLGEKIEKMMGNIFKRFNPKLITSTNDSNDYGKGSGGTSRVIRGLILQKLKKLDSESYLEYLLRIRIINLKGLIQLEISESGRSKETLLIGQKIANENIPLFRFLKIIGNVIIPHMEQGKGADLDSLVNHYNDILKQEMPEF